MVVPTVVVPAARRSNGNDREPTVEAMRLPSSKAGQGHLPSPIAAANSTEEKSLDSFDIKLAMSSGYETSPISKNTNESMNIWWEYLQERRRR